MSSIRIQFIRTWWDLHQPDSGQAMISPAKSLLCKHTLTLGKGSFNLPREKSSQDFVTPPPPPHSGLKCVFLRSSPQIKGPKMGLISGLKERPLPSLLVQTFSDVN